MKGSTRLVLVGLLSLALVGLPLLPDGPLRALQVDEQRVALAFAADGGGAWISAPVEGDHTIAGLTWEDPEDAPAQAEVRVRADGEWGDWEVVPTDDEHAPDPGTSEDARARGGTAPVVVEGADAVQFRVTDDAAPADLAADLVAVDDPDATRRIRERPSSADATPETPDIHPRSDWGGESCPGPDREPIEYVDRVAVMFVHHTTGYTSYAPEDVPGIVRAICSYHVNSRGWDDIGYNALVDRFGGIWVGRDGGIDKGVWGAHTGGFNGMSTGVAFIGDHQNGGAPTTAAREALADYAAWKFDLHSVDPLGTSTLTSRGSSRWKEDLEVTFDNLSGHRDASYTSCPGQSCYTLLDDFRAAIDGRGGFRIFGGWAQAHTMELQDDGTWERPTFTFEFTDEADWTFQLLDRDGRVVLEDSGTASGPVNVPWDATIGGRPAPKDAYTSVVTARRVSDGAPATTARHVVELGGVLGEFEDVDDDNTFHDDIEWLAIEGVTRGCNPPTNTRFCPDGDVTRGQMAAFLDRALDLPDAPSAGFRDTGDHVFVDEIDRLAAAGITRGCNPPANDRFCPDQPVSRKQMAAFLVRALDLGAADHPGFRDVPAGSTFDDDIRRLATAGVTRGCNPPKNDRYCPDGSVSRAQMAAFLRRGLTP